MPSCTPEAVPSIEPADPQAKIVHLHVSHVHTEPLRGHQWKKINVISLPRNHFVITKYVISFP